QQNLKSPPISHAFHGGTLSPERAQKTPKKMRWGGKSHQKNKAEPRARAEARPGPGAPGGGGGAGGGGARAGGQGEGPRGGGGGEAADREVRLRLVVGLEGDAHGVGRRGPSGHRLAGRRIDAALRVEAGDAARVAQGTVDADAGAGRPEPPRHPLEREARARG